MRRRRKNQKREKMIMLCSSVFVLTALTMTGLYVKDKNNRHKSHFYYKHCAVGLIFDTIEYGFRKICRNNGH